MIPVRISSWRSISGTTWPKQGPGAGWGLNPSLYRDACDASSLALTVEQPLVAAARREDEPTR